MYFRLRWQRENGLMNRMKRIWFPKKPDCEGGSRGFLTVGLQETKPALQLLAIGTGLSLAIMIVEIFVNSLQLHIQKQQLTLRMKRKISEKQLINKY